ncbi:nuclear transport factor 2 family protein [Aureivirga marina]|uniref:nuclear transport factor 2 family protein n=1 Tax=Aureivirga marina TaxID=1182451 RepID=UPI0018CA2E8A|nr:nuclear transport factor 2 family protein [Aureivirga marina]
MKTENAKKVVENYFQAFKNGNMEEIEQIFHEDCLIVSVKENENRKTEELHGTYRKRENVRQFITNILALFHPKEFDIKRIISEENTVVAIGKFVHEVKSTGKLFKSDWVQICIIEDSKIKEYRFFEDSAALLIASKK